MKSDKDNRFYDVVVIGGGPAGLMAAGRAAECGAKVALLEKNEAVGRKLMITGKGRCNITQGRLSTKELIEKYGKNGRFLYNTLSKFGPDDVIKFFEDKGVKTKVERGGRVFPESDRAEDVVNALIDYLKKGKIEIIYKCDVREFTLTNGLAASVKTSQGEIKGRNFIIATGGLSYPATGSTGAGYDFAAAAGHSVSALAPSLTPLKVKEAWVKDLQGLSLKNVELSAWQNGKKQTARFGEMLFTHFGVSGPIVLDISFETEELLKRGEVQLVLDLKPALDFTQLDERVQRDFKEYNNKLFRNSLDDLLPKKLIPVIINLSGIDSEKQVNKISRDERRQIVKLLKGLTMTAAGSLGFDTAIVTHGGVELKDIDPKTMRSKIIDNLYFAGEVLDLSGPTGGYNLQVAWGTGYVAGESAAQQ